jgi:hypothetical protein
MRRTFGVRRQSAAATALLSVPQHRAKRSKAGSRFACPRTPKPLARQPNVAHPTVPSVIREKAVSHEKAQKAQKKESFALTGTFTEW